VFTRLKEISNRKPVKSFLQILSKIDLNSPFFIFNCGGLLGAVFYIYIFCTASLNFTYTDWLMKGGDLSQHYLGWKFFRNSSWHFPLGLIDNIVYPFKVSVIYTDSIPLFAIIFKILSPVLPENFQYFGLFGIMCYILQGGIGALVIRKIGGNASQSIIGSLFFIFSTVMMWRIYGHTSLSGHFIILLCVLAYLQNNINLKKMIFIWSSLLVLSVLIHLYFAPMVMIFMFFRLLQEYLLSKELKKQCIIFVVSVLVLTGTMYCLGAFYFVNDPSLGGLGHFSANINTFINPQGWSRFIKDLPLATEGQYEGFAYLGLGIILFVFIVISQLFQKNMFDLKLFKKQTVFPVLGVLLSFALFSLSPTITFFQYKLFTYPVIEPFKYLWNIFRATGRMTWPILYIIIIFCVWWAIIQFSVKKSVLFLSIFLLIQWIDLKPSFINKGNLYKTKVTWQTELSSPVWENLANEYKHIFFMTKYTKLYSFLDLAVRHKITVNDAYLARSNQRMINGNKDKEEIYLINNGPRDDTIYVFENELQAYSFSIFSIDMQFYFIDGVTIGLSEKKISTLPFINLFPMPFSIPFPLSRFQKYINDVQVNESGFFEIYKDGILYGPYITLKPGNYTLKVDCEFDNSIGNPMLAITTDFGKKIIQTYLLINGENNNSFTLDDKFDNIEFVIRNEIFPKIEVKSMFLNKDDLSSSNKINKVLLFKTGSNDLIYLIKGFSDPEVTHIWTDQEEAKIKIPIQINQSDLRLTIKGFKLTPLQTVKFVVNDRIYGNLENGDNEFIIKVEDLINQNYLDIKLNISKPYTPKELGINDDPRTLGFLLQSIVLYECEVEN